MKTNAKILVTSILCLIVAHCLPESRAAAAVMNDYCNIPPFVAQSVPPLVLLTTGRDHKLYYEAFNEAMDLDEDGRVDIGYMHNIDYYGYFDSYKCYSYDNSGSGLFSPVSTTANKFCSSGQWSGNVLNWLTMSRMDVLRKVLYGGHRSTDSTSSTILERVYVPGDAHSWGKEIPGGLCGNGSVFKNTCYNNSDCETGYTCTDKSLNLIGMAKADSPCPASAVTWSSATAGKIVVATFSAQAGGATNGPTHADLLNSFYTDATNNTVSPLSLIDMAASGNPPGTSTKVKYITNFNDTAVDPTTAKTDYTNLLAVTAFTTANNDNMTGIWQFAVDGDDGVEIEILPNNSNKQASDPANWIVANYYGAHGACFPSSALTSGITLPALCDQKQSSLNNGFFNSTLTGKIRSKSLSTCTGTIDTLGSTASNGYCVNGGILLGKNTKYYMIVRQTNGTSLGGVKVWYRKPLDGPNAWNIFGANTDLTLSSPTIAPGNECSIRFKAFVDKADTSRGESRQHLFCSTTRSVAGTPVLRLLKNRIERKWNWASKERPVCADVIRKIDDSADITLSVDTTKTDAAKIWDYTVRNEVCKNTTPDNRPASKQDVAASGKETNCRPYTSGSTTTYKPAGLLQKYGEGDGTKVCSRTYSKSCTADSDCSNTTAVSEGLCIERAPMYFGLMTDSYLKNLSGGVLRKDIWSLGDEINMATGQFIVPSGTTAAAFNTTFPQGGIIPTFEAFRTVGFQYSSNSYEDNSTAGNAGGPCGWIVNNPLPEGNCRMWGNPIGEMMYEGLRYLAGKADPTTPTFVDTTVTQDGSLPIFKQDWGVVRGGTKYRPYGDKDNKNAIFPVCSKPFMLVLSDENVSYDSNQIPGTGFTPSFAEDSGLPTLNLNVSAMTDIIGGSGGENIEGTTVFIGDNNTVNDFICKPKTATKLSLIRGLCPEEPTKAGSYYAAGVAYYGKTQFTLNTQQLNSDGTVKVVGKPNVNTFSVVLSSPVPKMVIPVNGKSITIVPVAKSFSGSGVETSCANRCTSSVVNSTTGSLEIKGCSTPASVTGSTVTAGSFCPSNQIVDFYVDTVLYDTNTPPNITYAKFRINFEDVEQGADHDMDAIATYEICTGKTCSPELTDSNKIRVSLSSDYSAGGIDQIMGFIISGTDEDINNPFLVIKDTGVPSGASVVGGMPLDWTHDFTASTSTNTATLLKSPLWYAAKWGAFSDGNSNGKPDVKGEWAKNCTKTNTADCDPDNYYLVVNPLKLEQQLDKALTDILERTSSGTAASIVNKRQESGANLLTAVFYPQREFTSNSKIKWAGDLQNYWFYFDPLFTNSGLREDTVVDNVLRLTDDYAVDMVFDTTQNKTIATRYSYDGKSTYSLVDSKDSDDLNALWKAGEVLFNRTAARQVYTNLTAPDFVGNDYSANFSSFSTANAATLIPYLQSTDVAAATKTINYTLGTDYTSLRNRTVTYKGTTSVWRLGDIISSTPKILSSNPVNAYHVSYKDTSYSKFIASTNYKKRATVFVGANDGMFHAFKLGLIDSTSVGDKRGTISGASLGSEQWAYVPRNALPYLGYIADPNYDHVYTVDLTPTLLDASIYCSSTDYWDCPRTTTIDTSITVPKNVTESTPDNLTLSGTSWRTLVIGGMGQGGASRSANGNCASSSTILSANYPDCVKAPINSAGFYDVGMSSIFAMDVTDPLNPTLKWEFTHPELGFATVEPAIVRVNGKTGGKPDSKTNGRWFAVFASGPTGPIQTISHQFYGRSDQTLRIFVVDLATGKLVRTFNTGDASDTKITLDTSGSALQVAKAFGGPLFTNAIDTDIEDAIDVTDSTNPGYYSTDTVYIGYTRSKIDTNDSKYKWDITSTGGGSTGGLLRLNTHDDTNPSNWTLSTVIDGTGPITSSIDRLYDKKDPETGKPKLWLYFGTGRYFYKDSNIDDADTRQAIYGIKDPCYAHRTVTGGTKTWDFWGIDPNCTTSLTKAQLTDSSLILDNYPAGKQGWFINLEDSSSTFKAERNITTPIHRTSGLITYTVFKPTADVCSFGGETGQYFVDYRTGGLPPEGSLKGIITIQLSTGAIVKVDLSKLKKNSDGSWDGLGGIVTGGTVGGRPLRLSLGLGKPPSQPPQDDRPKKPVKRILHIQER